LTSTNGIYLLDTNALIAILNGDTSILHAFQGVEVVLSIISVGELFHGAEKSGRVQANLTKVESFIAKRTILFCDVETARYYGRIRTRLQRKGRPITLNDIWIAATAMQYDLTVITNDSDFQNVDDLRIQSW